LNRHFAYIKPANNCSNPAIHLNPNRHYLALQRPAKKHFDPVIIIFIV
jgi:hypothetical protein